MRRLKWILSGLLAIVLLVVLAQNSATTTLSLLWMSVEMPQFVALAGALGAGVLLGLVLRGR